MAYVDSWRDIADLKSCARAWATRMKVKPRRIQVQVMTNKWASCSRAGTLTLSKDLLTHDRKFGEAVIVHELVHLIVPNHGKLFGGLLRSFMPDAEAILRGQTACGFRR